MISKCFHYFQSCKAPQNNRVKKTAAYNFRLQSSITKGSASKFHPKAPKLLSWILPHLRFSSQAISITFWCSNFPCKKKAGSWVAKSWNDFYTVCRNLFEVRLFKPTNCLLFFPGPPKKITLVAKVQGFSTNPRFQLRKKCASGLQSHSFKSQMFKLFGVNLTPFCGWKNPSSVFPSLGTWNFRIIQKWRGKSSDAMQRWFQLMTQHCHDWCLPWLQVLMGSNMTWKRTQILWAKGGVDHFEKTCRKYTKCHAVKEM